MYNVVDGRREIMTNDLKFYTTQEVADMLKQHEETIRRKLRTGELKGVNLGGRWRITQEELMKYLEGK